MEGKGGLPYTHNRAQDKNLATETALIQSGKVENDAQKANKLRYG